MPNQTPQRVEIPKALLCKLASPNGKIRRLNAGAMLEIAEILDIPTTGDAGQLWWNQVITHLDTHYPGWRGYEVTYRNGMVA